VTNPGANEAPIAIQVFENSFIPELKFTKVLGFFDGIRFQNNLPCFAGLPVVFDMIIPDSVVYHLGIVVA